MAKTKKEFQQIEIGNEASEVIEVKIKKITKNLHEMKAIVFYMSVIVLIFFSVGIYALIKVLG